MARIYIPVEKISPYVTFHFVITGLNAHLGFYVAMDVKQDLFAPEMLGAFCSASVRRWQRRSRTSVRQGKQV